MKSDEHTDRILVTKDFAQTPESVMGYIALDKSTYAYQMLTKYPGKFCFEIGYTQDGTNPDNVVLTEVSLVMKK